MIKIKTKEEIKKMRKAGKLAGELLIYLEPFVKEGVSTQYLNDLAEEFTKEHGAISAPLNYNGFPKSMCTSINNVVCHGIPSEKEILKDGDIINLDVTVILDGYHGDTSKTFLVGNVDEEVVNLVKRTENAMYKGIEAIKPGKYLYEVGKTIEKYINKFGYSIVRDYTGHGIGAKFHEEPAVFHNYTAKNRIRLKEGMIFTVEPMINMGKSHRTITSKEDGWTVTTADNSISAQFEHTVLVTSKGVEILTKVD
ncbi:type I methionyl aminopeptidase [Haliovirga abyssi]|uniref:Methionine aminopeptidase n=1 Tax=Haliovirga abyssi TaxID=2996794 RepID=A0AAU9D452_9FUSO|nr:type I methionyl aminopeptidase [Haliovirga abyssi]BDU50756.1 methionine aminopeptidase [Haliovirga abyssi]